MEEEREDKKCTPLICDFCNTLKEMSFNNLWSIYISHVYDGIMFPWESDDAGQENPCVGFTRSI